MQRTWTFGEKLALGFLLVVLLTVTMGGVSLVALRSVVAGKDEVIDGRRQDLIDAQRVLALTSQKVATGRTYLLTGEERYATQMRDKDAELGRALDELNRPRRGLRAPATRSDRQGPQRPPERARRGRSSLRRSGADLAAFGGRFEAEVAPRYDTLVDRDRGVRRTTGGRRSRRAGTRPPTRRRGASGSW